MRVAFVCAVFATVLVATVHASQLEEYTVKALEDFRTIMPSGRNEWNIPVLEPAIVNEFPIDIRHRRLKAKFNAKTSQVVGLSSFQVGNINVDQKLKTMTVDVFVPKIDIHGKYDVDGKILLDWFGFDTKTLHDQGSYNVSIRNLKLVFTATALLEGGHRFEVGDVRVDSLNNDEIHIQLDNILSGGRTGEKANEVFNMVLPNIVKDESARLFKALESVLNRFLDAREGRKEDHDTLEALIKEFSDNFREVMRHGGYKIGMPIMDPAIIKKVPIRFHHWPIDNEIIAQNIRVVGGSNFNLTNVAEKLGTGNVTLDLKIPTLEVTCDVQSIFKMGFIKWDITKKGPFSLKLKFTGLNAAISSDLFIDRTPLPDDHARLNFTQLQIDSLSYETVEINVEKMSYSGLIGKMFKSLINYLTPNLIKAHKRELMTHFSERGARIVKHYLDSLAKNTYIEDLDTRATALLEQLRTVLKSGGDEYINLPVLDPVTIAHVPFSFSQKVVSADIVVKNINVSGTSTYVTKVSRIDFSNKLGVEVWVPLLNGTGSFDASGKAALFPFEDHGSMAVNITGLKVIATADMSEDPDGFLVLNELAIDSWTYDDVQAQFANLQENKALKLLNEIINTIIPIVEKAKYHSIITSWAETTSKRILTEFLTGVAAETKRSAPIESFSFPEEAKFLFKKLAVAALQEGLSGAA